MTDLGSFDMSPEAGNLPPPSAPIRAALRDAARLALWRRPRPVAARISGLAMATAFAIFVLATVAYQYAFAARGLPSFNPYGLNSLVAAAALQATALVAFSHFDRTGAAARNLMLVYGLMMAFTLVEYAVLAALPVDTLRSPTLTWTLFLSAPLAYVWLIGAARQAFKAAPAVRRPTLRAFGFVVSLIVAALAAPSWPVFAAKNFDRSFANLWEVYKTYARATQSTHDDSGARREAEAAAARLEADQGPLLAAALARLAPREADKANVFTVGVAGWSEQDVFLAEINQSTAILKDRFGLGDRTLRLINNAKTAQSSPMASMQNIAETLRGVGLRMDRERDLLVLVLSSHGSPDGFALTYDDFVQRSLDPETLRQLLDDAGIKNRVVIVSSCYSGTFIAPLRTPDTMILTAASADRTSFGCSDDRKWTWFGEALFEKALAERAPLADAFAAARATIATWEREQNVTASNPQIFVGENIAANFPDIVGKPSLATLGALAPAGGARSE